MLKKIGIAVLAVVGVAVAAQVLLYTVDGHAIAETGRFLSDARYRVDEQRDGGFVFRPSHPNGRSLVIMHGALIEPRSYANTAAFFAGRGYTVFLPAGAMRLSITAVDDAAARLGEFDVDDWYFIGHSMGGLAVLELLRRNAAEVRAVALWAARMPFDFSDVDVPILFLWGNDDGLLTADGLASAKTRLPAATRYVTVDGGNHRNFAMYSHQFFDNDGTLDWREQIAFANERTAAFFESPAD